MPSFKWISVVYEKTTDVSGELTASAYLLSLANSAYFTALKSEAPYFSGTSVSYCIM
jgi:hypothetical protein